MNALSPDHPGPADASQGLEALEPPAPWPWIVDLDLSAGRGLEIGPLSNPRLTKLQARIEYVDHVSRDELVAKYRDNADMADKLDRIADVDHVQTPGTRLVEAVGVAAAYDFVIASHVFEHLANPVGWLGEVAEVLRPGGRLVLTIPDKRFCFDVNRPLTRPADLVDAHIRDLTHPSYRMIFDFESSIIAVDALEAWGGRDYRGVVRDEVGDPAVYAYGRCLQARDSGEYLDVHNGVYTDASWLDCYEVLARLGLLPYRVRSWYPTRPQEIDFTVVLEKLPDGEPQQQVEEAIRSVPPHASVLFPQPGEAVEPRLVPSDREVRFLALKRRVLGAFRSRGVHR